MVYAIHHPNPPIKLLGHFQGFNIIWLVNKKIKCGGKCTLGWVVQRVRIKKFDFLIATFIFICVLVCRKIICKKFFRKQQSSFGGFDLNYIKVNSKKYKGKYRSEGFFSYYPLYWLYRWFGIVGCIPEVYTLLLTPITPYLNNVIWCMSLRHFYHICHICHIWRIWYI